MNFIEHFNPAKLQVLDRWTRAPEGALVQLNHPAFGHVLAMRSTYETGNGGKDVIVVVGGPKAGEIFVGEEVDDVAFAVDDLAELVFEPFNPATVTGRATGEIARAKNEALFVSCRSAGGWTGYLCVGSKDPNIPFGRMLGSITSPQTIGLKLNARLRGS